MQHASNAGDDMHLNVWAQALTEQAYFDVPLCTPLYTVTRLSCLNTTSLLSYRNTATLFPLILKFWLLSCYCTKPLIS